MLALLPFLAVILLAFIFHSEQRCWRSSILSASLVFGVFIVVSTEALSLLHLISFAMLVCVWLLATSLLIWLALKKKAFHSIPTSLELTSWNQLNLSHKLLYLGISTIILVIGVIAIVAPPNNWDSMSYVMPRVIHWVQNHSVEHYPAHYTSQLYNGPWAEFTLIHLQLLSGGDWLANVPQWLSMIGCLIAVSLLAKQLGADRRGQLFSVLVCATIPVGILQASNSKNTYIIVFWLVCLTYYGILLIKSRPTWSLVLAASTSFSLAVLTKGTAYVYALPFIIWVALSVILRVKEKTFVYLIGSNTTFLLINIGHYLRNLLTFGSPTSTYPYKWGNELYNLPAFISNVMKNISLHLIPPFFDREGVDCLVTRVHQLLGVDPIDSRLNLFLGGYQPTEFTTQSVQFFEDTAGNSFHFWLALLAIVLFFKDQRLRKNKILLGYCLATVFSFLSFCLLIKWQLWHSRLHLPIFVLMCPFIGIVLAQALKRSIAQFILIILLATASPYLLLNETRPIAAAANIFNTDRTAQYFAARSTLQADYISVADLVKQNRCDEIGLIQRPDAWEYPLWLLLTQTSQRPIRVENVNVTNPSKAIEQNAYYQDFHPCMLISIGLQSVQQLTVHQQSYGASKWQNADTSEPMQVFFKR